MEQETQIKQRVINEIGKAVIGKEEVIIKAFATILAGGHILFEDIPGVVRLLWLWLFQRCLVFSIIDCSLLQM